MGLVWWLGLFQEWFLLRILKIDQNDNHSKHGLTKFGYILNMKFFLKKTFYIIGHLLKLIILMIWIFLVHLLMEK